VREAARACAGFWGGLDEDAAALLGLSLTPALSRRERERERDYGVLPLNPVATT